MIQTIHAWPMRAAVGCAALAVVAATAFTPARAQMSIPIAAAAQPQDGVVAGPVQDPQKVLDYWTPRRMKQAENMEDVGERVPPAETPADGSDELGNVEMTRPYVEAPISRITGALFGYSVAADRPAICTASVITSQTGSVIVTADHCVRNFFGGVVWMKDLMFVPAYNGALPDRQRTPLGSWPLRQAFAPSRFMGPDIATAYVYPRNGLRLQDVVGGGFTPLLTGDETFLYGKQVGYPGLRAYDGTQQGCSSRIADAGPGYLTLPQCGGFNGNSGGPLLASHTEDGPFDRIVSVVHAGQSFRFQDPDFSALRNAADFEIGPPQHR